MSDLPDPDLWPGQCEVCGKDEADCHCDDDLDADLIPESPKEKRWREALERLRDWHDD